MNYIGKSITRPDAIDKVRGSAKYPGDINLPDQALYESAILFPGTCNCQVD